MSAQAPDLNDLTPLARGVAQAAHEAWLGGDDLAFGVQHWLAELAARAPGVLAALAPGVDLSQVPAGAELDLPTVVAAAVSHAAAAGRGRATIEDVAMAVLESAGITAAPDAAALHAALLALAPEEADPGPRRSGGGEPDEGGEEEEAAARPGRRRRGGTMLSQFGHDLTAAAQAGKLAEVLGRESEIDLVVETLCRRTKRNPALIGPAGVGKTAIAEGLAQRIAAGRVPDLLKHKRVVALPASSLVAGAGVVGELEQRMEKLLDEARAQNVILFIDELHTIVGAGASSTHRSGDVANMLKPGLARGDFACIAATTDDEYRHYIEPDSALERRFQPIRIQEMTPAQTLAILRGLAAQFAASHGVAVADRVLSWLLDFAGRFMHNRFFPDKAIDLLEQCVAHAVTAGHSAVERDDAEAVAQRVVGMPLELDHRLIELRHRLRDRALLLEPDVEALGRRLEVTLRGLDLRPTRPNACILLLGAAAAASEAVATTIADILFGAADRVVTVDLGGFVDPSHVSMLLGSGPGYVGYGDTLPLHRLTQTPWSVLRLEHIDVCHPAVREVLKQALADGYLAMGDGKRVYLSDAVVVMTAALSPEGRRVAGFRHVAEKELDQASARSLAAKTLGEGLLEEIDVVAAGNPTGERQRRRWLQEQILPELKRRYHERRVKISWDEGLLDWLANRESAGADVRDWERIVENQLAPLLIPYLPHADQDDVELALGVGGDGQPEIRVAES
jgi:ATP-dependent Clp protease ATP-binding subunit ClpC